jgi:peptidoglycan/xylan/chitin deacetylase (PgdA/CDA1 family)
LLALRDDGHVIGGHTRTHPRLLEISPEQRIAEVQGGRQDLQDLTGDSVDTFAFPFGNGANDDTVVQVVKDAGFTASRTSMPGFNRPNSDRFKLRRFPDDWRNVNLAAAKAKIEEAISTKQWLIFELHEIIDVEGQFNTAPQLLRDILEFVASRLSPDTLRAVSTIEGVALMDPV